MELADGLKTELILQSILEGCARSKSSLKVTCYSIADLVFKNDDRYRYSPKELLIDSVNENREIGSSTCVLATLDEYSPILYTANIGDSGYLLLRKEGIDLITKFRSKEQ